MTENTTCCCCDKPADDHRSVNCLFGRLCEECRKVARDGSNPYYLTRVKGVSPKTGRWTYSRESLKAFA